MLLQLNDVSKSFGAQPVLRDVTFQINPGEKIGLIGSNGSGKTTLLKILSGVVEADNGVVSRKSGLQIGILEQIPIFHDDTSVMDEALRAFQPLLAAEAEMRSLEHEISGDAQSDALDRYAMLQHAFELRGGYRFRAMTEAALLGVGFGKDALERPARVLSGGEKNRLALAKLLLSEADLLLLDEPTNHLDIRSIEWLERFLQETAKTVVVVSHDRIFLDRVVNRVLEVIDTRMNDYRGNYTAYLRERAERLARQEKEWRLQRKWISEQEDYIRRNLAGQKTKQAQSRRTFLGRVQRVEKPKTASAAVKFRFLPVERGSRYVLRARHLAVGYDKPLINDVSLDIERQQRWAVLGANGSGKTTLLRTVTGAVAPLSGELEWRDGLDVGYYDQQLSDLETGGAVIDEIRALDATAGDGELRSYLAQFLFSGDDVFKKVGSLSGGEKSRLALAKIIYEGPSLLALDEPTNHLDIASREALESALAEYPGTILFVTHDRYLAQKIATHLMYIENGAAFVFDRLDAFEEWLTSRPATAKSEVQGADPPAEARASTEMSKNRREKLQSEVAVLESQIASQESDLAAMELAFNSPDNDLDWAVAHRKYLETKQNLEKLYADLATRWDQLSA